MTNPVSYFGLTHGGKRSLLQDENPAFVCANRFSFVQMFVAYRGRISREWRQKIESWLQANEADEKQNDDFKKKRKLLSANRRSYETDNESDRGGSKLDPLPEEKPPTMTSPEQQPASGLATTSYKRVYQDWKPSSALEKTDVVGTMEAIAGRR